MGLEMPAVNGINVIGSIRAAEDRRSELTRSMRDSFCERLISRTKISGPPHGRPRAHQPSWDQAICRSRVVTPGVVETGVSGFISYDLCKLAGRVPRPSLIFLLQGASMRCFVSWSIDFGSRLR